MNVIRRRGWQIPDRFATPEHLAFSRRTVLTGAASALALAPYAANAQRLTDVVNSVSYTHLTLPTNREV